MFASTATLVRVPLSPARAVGGARAVRDALPAHPRDRRTVAAAFLQATSLPFIMAAAAIGQELGALSAATGKALIAAGLVSVLVFPAVAVAVLRGGEPGLEPTTEPAASAAPARTGQA